jgi:hypothetical protein
MQHHTVRGHETILFSTIKLLKQITCNCRCALCKSSPTRRVVLRGSYMANNIRPIWKYCHAVTKISGTFANSNLESGRNDRWLENSASSPRSSPCNNTAQKIAAYNAPRYPLTHSRYAKFPVSVAWCQNKTVQFWQLAIWPNWPMWSHLSRQMSLRH